MAASGKGRLLRVLAALLLIRDAGSQTFSAAEVKPHWQCNTAAGQSRVLGHIAGLTSQRTGIVALIQFEFALPQPSGYTAFGAACVAGHADSVVVLVEESQFSVVAGIGATVLGNYSAMPYVSGQPPVSGSMCIADPSRSGERAYAGAVLRHAGTGEELCAVAGTFPHCYEAWQPQFLTDIEQECQGRPLLLVVDTNAACETQGPLASRAVSMEDIAKNHSAAWGRCSEPSLSNASPTCCHDLGQGHPEARYWYDRTSICGGGSVEDFQVLPSFVCGTDQEHKFTTAVIQLREQEAHATRKSTVIEHDVALRIVA